MREICLSGSMSGNRKQDQAKPDCGGEAKAPSNIHRETTVTAPVLDSTPHYTHWSTLKPHISSGLPDEVVLRFKAGNDAPAQDHLSPFCACDGFRSRQAHHQRN